MLPNPKYLIADKSFWAHVKFLSENIGYSDRGTSKLKTYTSEEIFRTMKKSKLSTKHLRIDRIDGQLYIEKLVEYLNYRSRILETKVEPELMNRDQAKEIFNKLKKELKPKCILPMNKQKGKKRHNAYLTGIVNMLTEKSLGTLTFDQDPHKLTLVTKNEKPIRTFTRRFDGAYPSTINPKSIWEVKEYYGTTTFGSRVADGLYESILDGEEFLEIKKNEGVKIQHYLIVDDHFTWWEKGKSYLCRMVDLLHSSYIDEVIFGKEVVTRWPIIVRSWIK